MTQAAKQCREYLEEQFPGIRIGRKACRPTSGGAISQHSAYGGPEPYDSNALDIMGGSTDGIAWGWDQNVELIAEVVDRIEQRRQKWSVRIILWQVSNHYGHAHIDFWPTILTPRQWCGGPETPAWTLSNGAKIWSDNPEPENGPYTGETTMPTTQWHQMIDALFAADGEFQGDPNYWKEMPEDSPEWADFWAAFARMIGANQ